MKATIFLITLLWVLNINAQDKITVITNTKGTFIETYDYLSYDDSYWQKEAYRLGPSATKVLKDGIDTAFKWIDLNKTHRKTFQKEICRFKVMDKRDFDFFGYTERLTKEIKLNFKGYSDNTFEIEITGGGLVGIIPFIKISDYNYLVGFKNLLDGKSANKEIDDIFKR